MADHGEWNRKGAVLSDVTAKKEYGVTREFIPTGLLKTAFAPATRISHQRRLGQSLSQNSARPTRKIH